MQDAMVSYLSVDYCSDLLHCLIFKALKFSIHRWLQHESTEDPGLLEKNLTAQNAGLRLLH